MLANMCIKVSIVEDDAPAREILADWLKRAPGFKCVGQHGTVEHALDFLPAEKPSVVLMDISLPGMSGIEGVRRLKPLLPETQFLMLTVYEDVDTFLTPWRRARPDICSSKRGAANCWNASKTFTPAARR